MSGTNEHERGFSFPNPVERIIHAGAAVAGIFRNDQAYFDECRRQLLEEKGYVEGIAIDLRERVGNFDHQDEIAESKAKHPSSRGYL